MLESLNIFIGSALVLAADFTSLVSFRFGAHVRLFDALLAGPVEGADDRISVGSSPSHPTRFCRNRRAP